MDGNIPARNTVDETLVEQGAAPITPIGAGNHLVINDAFDYDLVIKGALIHNNSFSIGGIDILGAATVKVETGAVIDMAANDDAQHWAGNTGIFFEDGAYYIHHTNIPNTITSGVLFPNADVATVPVFVLADNYTYPGAFNQLQPLTLNGVLEITQGKTFTQNRGGVRNFRNGIRGDGNLVLQDSAITRITGLAELSDTGKISVNTNRALFEIATGSHTVLNNNRVITTLTTAAERYLPFQASWMV